MKEGKERVDMPGILDWIVDYVITPIKKAIVAILEPAITTIKKPLHRKKPRR